jgi:glycosyltransferase involved in cell wall biosynthesis
MSPSNYLVIYARIFLGNRIILDAGWALYDGTVVSRNKYGFDAIKSYLIDFFTAKIAKQVIVESELQKKFFSKMFLVRKKKLRVIYTGIDEDSFSTKSKIQLPLDIFRNGKVVLFRGKFNSEAGLEVLAQATKILKSKKITFWILCPGLPSEIIFSSNSIVDKRFLPKNDIAKIQKASALTLGQLAAHKRLSRTIPHKAYESAFLKSPYLTGRNFGILEIFTENKELFCFNPGDAGDLARKILDIFDNPIERNRIGNGMYQKYISTLNQKILASEFINVVRSMK